MSDPQPFDDLVQQILEGGATRQVRLAASRGALPLPRTVLVRLYIALRQDAEDEVRSSATASLEQLDPGTVREVLEDDTCAPEVLVHFARQAVKDEALAERIAFHKAVPASAMVTLAAGGNAKVIDLVLTNQQRLLSEPEILDRLSLNPALRADQRGRILELLQRVSKQRVKDAALGDEAEDEDDLADELQVAARLLDVDVGELFAASEIIDGEEFATAEDPQIRSAYARILTLNTAQKAILAMRGGREERMILVRDSNNLVALAVLRNPRISDHDVESVARMRSVSAEVLREVGHNRDWVKSYAVVQSLVRNPRTPPGVSTNFVSRLRNQDLKQVLSSHDVPELIRRMAKKTLDTRTQQSSSLRRK